ncbi:unnamed protein product [marine sediment metagenome]|uniref:GxxExxY protein n=1 Tax=marine sediment metagenome TaxID=412755 RepID=X0ZE35_9ZZZZ
MGDFHPDAHVKGFAGFNLIALICNKFLPIISPTFSMQQMYKVYYETEEVGDYYADLLIDDLVIIELKAAESLCEEHEAQLINYLKATKMEIGLLLNFDKKAEFKRKIFTNDRK